MKLIFFAQKLLVPDTCLNHLVVRLLGKMCVLLIFSVPLPHDTEITSTL